MSYPNGRSSTIALSVKALKALECVYIPFFETSLYFVYISLEHERINFNLAFRVAPQLQQQPKSLDVLRRELFNKTIAF